MATMFFSFVLYLCRYVFIVIIVCFFCIISKLLLSNVVHCIFLVFHEMSVGFFIKHIYNHCYYLLVVLEAVCCSTRRELGQRAWVALLV